jgi:branched-subunit amino acid ABC-type transport system permease component
MMVRPTKAFAPNRSTTRLLKMNFYLLSAGALAFVVGYIHSVLGERLIFSRMRNRGLIPTQGGQLIHESHVRILWATWHVVTAIGWGLAAILVWYSLPASPVSMPAAVGVAVAMAMLVSSRLVLVGTRGRNPGWLGLLGVGVLTVIGLNQVPVPVRRQRNFAPEQSHLHATQRQAAH